MNQYLLGLAPAALLAAAGAASAADAANAADAVPARPFAAAPVADSKLSGSRAGSATSVTGVTGSLQQTSAVNVQSGANTVRDGSFAGALGLTTVIQNSGANVLIQNATTVNVQFK